jgi:formate hydrogenlyase subunit 3/multisubunit Na+/H+ antiporter MnhD subunit
MVDGFEFVSVLFIIHIIVILIGVTSLLFISDRLKSFVAITSVVIIGCVTSLIAIKGITTNGLEFNFNGGSFIGTIPFRIDALSAWFMLIINLISATGVIYGVGYLKAYNAQRSIITFHWVSFILFQSSMLWVCAVQNSIAFLIAWELMSLSSLLLVLFDHTNNKVLKAGINYMVQMHLSVVFLTVAFIWVYFKTGTFDFKGIGMYFGANVNIWLFLVFFIGFGFKAGFIGLHTWLPHAHPAAPSHVSGVMSGVIVKMGIYGIFRIITFVKSDYVVLGEIVLVLSLLTGLFGILNAAVHRDFKRMLAYCTIENIGIIGIGIGLGLIGIGTNNEMLYFLGFGGALLHVLNHSLFKSLLFYSAGSVYQQTHTRNMDKLGGLVKVMPQTAIIFLIGAIAIGGIPPFNGFVSEFMIYFGLLKGINSAEIGQITLMVLTFAGMGIIGGLSVLAFTKTFGAIFLGSARQNLKHEPHEVSALMLAPQYFTIAVMMFVAFMPGFFVRILRFILHDRFVLNTHLENPDYLNYLSLLSRISFFSLLFLILIVLVFGIRSLVLRKQEKIFSSTWGCAYQAPGPRMQYTGKSFSKTLGKLLNFSLIEKKSYKELKSNEIFPKSRRYSSFYLDVFEQKLIDPFIQRLKQFINLFNFVQNGKVQAYVLYGIMFILVVFLGTLLNFWH